MNNLFNSRKLFAALYLAKAPGHEVVCISGSGLSPSVQQLKKKNIKEAQNLRGRTAAARLVNSPECPNLLACLVYDTKPMHMQMTVEESILWVVKKRRIWSQIQKQMKQFGFLHPNFIENYNKNMNGVDITNQL